MEQAIRDSSDEEDMSRRRTGIVMGSGGPLPHDYGEAAGIREEIA